MLNHNGHRTKEPLVLEVDGVDLSTITWSQSLEAELGRFQQSWLMVPTGLKPELSPPFSLTLDLETMNLEICFQARHFFSVATIRTGGGGGRQ